MRKCTECGEEMDQDQGLCVCKRRASGSLERMVSRPRRIQLSRKKGWKLPTNTVLVDRRTKYGNPHYIGFCGVCGVDHTREESVREFEAMLLEALWATKSLLEPLRGKNLACWCRLDQPCHADVLLRLANIVIERQ
jgi:hypothetical protein